MQLNQALIAELTHEGANTRKMLELAPTDRFEWRPHGKSMALGRLCGHIIDLPFWVNAIVSQTTLDVTQRPYTPTTTQSGDELGTMFDKKMEVAKAALSSTTPEELMQPWTLMRGGNKLFTMPRVAAIRTMFISHLIHHRGQLSVYLRLLDVRVPGMYGPSADEQP